MSRLRTLATIAGLALFVWLSIEVYRSRSNPEEFHGPPGGLGWIVGPPSRSLEQAAARRIEEGLARLNDPALPSGERIRLYHEQLRSAEELLLRSLRAQPAQARTLARLAAVRWELAPPLSGEQAESFLETVAVASRMAPTVPGVQRQLGELLLKMGRETEALSYLSRTLELDPARAREVVTVLGNQLFEPQRILELLPTSPELLVALELPYVERGRSRAFVLAIEQALDRESVKPTAPLLTALGNGCLRIEEPGRLLERLERIPPLGNPRGQAELSRQRSRALLALGRAAESIDAAREAVLLQPDSVRAAEWLADAALASGAFEEAHESLLAALGLAARRPDDPRTRGRLYRKIGRAEEGAGHPALAYDAYRRALALNPGESFAARRVAEMEAAAGFDPQTPGAHDWGDGPDAPRE